MGREHSAKINGKVWMLDGRVNRKSGKSIKCGYVVILGHVWMCMKWHSGTN